MIDEFTVRINFSSPYAPFLSNLAKVDLGIVSPAAARKFGDAYPQNPVGTGPFRLAKLTAGVQVELEKNPDYNWAPESAGHQGPAYLDKLTIKFVPEEATRVSVLQSGQVHLADIIPPQNLLAFKSNSNFNVQEVELLQINHSYYFNLTKDIWQDLELRKAIRAAFNLEAAVRAIYLGTSKQAWSPLSTQHFTYNPQVENSWKHDLAYANSTLDRLGWVRGSDGIREKNGQKLVLEFIDTQGNREKRLDLHAVLTQQLRQAGVELKLLSLPSGTYSERRLKREYDFVAASQFSGDGSILRQIFSTLGPTGDRNVSSVKDPQLEQWLEEALTERDPQKIKELYQKAQQYIIDNVYSIPTYVFDYSVASAKKVHGITFDNPAWPVFYDAWIEK